MTDYEIKQIILEKYEASKKKIEEIKKMISNEKEYHNRKICLFGAGQNGIDQYIRLIKEGWSIDFFSDNNEEKWETDIVDGKICYEPAKIFSLYKNENIFFIITSERGGNEIYRQLREAGYRNIIFIYDYFFTYTTDILKYSAEEVEKEVNWLLTALEDQKSKEVVYELIRGLCAFSDDETMYDYQACCSPDMYFPKDIIRFGSEDVLVDGGGFIGDTILDFVSRGYDYKKYFCYELNKANYLKMKENITGNSDKVICFNLGIGKTNEIVRYDLIGASSEKNETGEMTGEIVSIDEHLSDEKITYIKMDVEGCETEALQGAYKTIKKNHPKLAICLYHKFSDLWNIPKLVKEYNSDYKIYIRHHTNVMSDTVMYAIER